MKKNLKKMLVVPLAVIVLIIIVAVTAIHAFGGRALKLGIEKVGTDTLKVDVTVEKVSFSLTGGWVKLEGLKVANPEGYQHEYLLELGSGEVQMNVKSLLSDKIVIENIKLDNVAVVIEQKELVHNNLQEILDALPSPEEEKTEADKPGKKVHVDKLVIDNATVKAKLLPIPGRADTVNLTLDTIELTDLGQDNKMTPAILVAEVLRAIAVGVAEKGRDLLPDDMIGAMTSVLEASGEIITETGKKILDKGKDVGKDLIEGIFGSKKD
jgi:hypothetical protein